MEYAFRKETMTQHGALTYFSYKTPIGSITLAQRDGLLVGLSFGTQHYPGSNKASEITNKAANQLQEYFAGKRKTFDLPLFPEGSAFQKQVWSELCTISYGETRSYRDIASALGNPNASRAVGLANNKNPIPLFIPCHRVIAANGTIGGYRGGTKVKKYLLDLEKAHRC